MVWGESYMKKRERNLLKIARRSVRKRKQNEVKKKAKSGGLCIKRLQYNNDMPHVGADSATE